MIAVVDTAAIAHALDVNYRNLALGHDVVEHRYATFVRNVTLPRIYDANFAYHVRAASHDEIAAFLADARTHYRHAERLTIRCDPYTPPTFEAALALEGFEVTTSLLMILDGLLASMPERCDIREVGDEPSWHDYVRLKRVDWAEHAARLGIDADDKIADDLARSARLKSPPVTYLIAYVDGRPVGYCQAWHGVHGVGQVEDLFVEHASRRRGIATSLIHAAVNTARARGADHIVIVADPADTPKAMYAAMGWRPVALMRQWGRTFTGSRTVRAEQPSHREPPR